MGIECYVTTTIKSSATRKFTITIVRSTDQDLITNTTSDFCTRMNTTSFDSKMHGCECQQQTTFFSDVNNPEPGCYQREMETFITFNEVDNNNNNDSTFLKTKNISALLHTCKLCRSTVRQCRIDKVFLWNLAISESSSFILRRRNLHGSWIDITGPCIEYFEIQNNSLLNIDLNLTKWQGQLIKLVTTCKQSRPIYLKILGRIIYPFNLRNLEIMSETNNMTSKKKLSKSKLIVGVAIAIPIIPIVGVIMTLLLCRRRLPRCIKKDTHINTSHSFDETIRCDDTSFTYFHDVDNDNDNFQIPTELPHEIINKRNLHNIVIKDGGDCSGGNIVLYSNAAVPISPNIINMDNHYEDLNQDRFATINDHHQYEEMVNNSANYQSLKTTKSSNSSSSSRQTSAFNNPMYDAGSPSIIRLNPDTTSTTMYAVPRDQIKSYDDIREPIYHELEIE